LFYLKRSDKMDLFDNNYTVFQTTDPSSLDVSTRPQDTGIDWGQVARSGADIFSTIFGPPPGGTQIPGYPGYPPPPPPPSSSGGGSGGTILLIALAVIALVLILK
jgi:hypothetical protein